MEAQEKLQKAELNLCLQVKKLEIEADNAVRLRQIVLDSQKLALTSAAATATVSLSSSVSLPQRQFDLSKLIT